MSILVSIHIKSTWQYMNVYSFNYSIVICFSESRNSIIIYENFTNFFFIGLRTPLKPTRTRTLNRIPIWYGLMGKTVLTRNPYHDHIMAITCMQHNHLPVFTIVVHNNKNIHMRNLRNNCVQNNEMLNKNQRNKNNHIQ